MDNIIRIENLVFEYIGEEENNLRAIDNVSIDIKKGEFVAILGQNGSGKSTIARNMNALLLPSGGKVYVKGLDITNRSKLWEIRQAAGMVFQDPTSQLVSTCVEDDVAFGPENLGIKPSEIRERVNEALKLVNMENHKKRAPQLLSGGQKQKVAIAGVIAMKPDCIIFDESTAMLDPQGKKDVMNIITKLNKEEGITVVLITHFMDEAVLADRLIIMDRGTVQLDGTPKDIFTQVDKVKEFGLEIPLAAELTQRLHKRGVNIPADIISIDEMVNFLCQ
ncbi:Polyamine-transporting ATPase [Syntrophobotulus glycolicus DSM 8271]|uniref:Polyamine-transporting ATPase n=1 Tax=Syntrophobotulus glycolicus (strain DSM 8271 / FlGlyR) TaxID=645991 RepID=F0SVS9_SYNGF|nr:energy-coupling factor transporter ATPase [Syntrophobotulus glycolicus]ADY55635.1 Polyamine-transporting ATPase [Syntrophobotulus glycolicus DSM 8271]